MRPDTRALRYVQAGSLPAQWRLLSKARRQYARELVEAGNPVRIAIQQAFIFGPAPRATRPRHCYAMRHGARATLARFDSRARRAQWLETMEQAAPGQWEPVTLAEARPRFDVRQFEADYQELYTQAGDAIRYIHQRPDYDL